MPVQLFSALRAKLATHKQETATPAQWAGIVSKLSQQGVSQTEIEWSGLLEHLASLQVRSVGKAALLAWLDKAPVCELALLRLTTNEFAPRVFYERQALPDLMPAHTVRRGCRELRLLQYLDKSFGLHIWLHVLMDSELFGRHCYWSVTVPRGRKKLAEVPLGRGFLTLHEALNYGRELVRRMATRLGKNGFVGQMRSDNSYTRWVLPLGEDYTEWMIVMPNFEPAYRGEHFDVPNIVAHVRTTRRSSPEGMRILLIEEVQSDWNQSLRKCIQGEHEVVEMPPPEVLEDLQIIYDPPPQNPFLNHWMEVALRQMLLLAVHQHQQYLAWLPGDLHAERFPWANAHGLEIFYDQHVRAAMEKLVKPWRGVIEQSSIETLSRCHLVEPVVKGPGWVVLAADGTKAIQKTFSRFEDAEQYRRSLESPVWETVNAVYLPPDMCEDIRANGLPSLGAIGQRL